MKKLVLIDGNSIMNRAFYCIMGSKALTTKDGKYTNAIYGFLEILFKLLEDEPPDYLAVSFDLKGQLYLSNFLNILIMFTKVSTNNSGLFINLLSIKL